MTQIKDAGQNGHLLLEERDQEVVLLGPKEVEFLAMEATAGVTTWVEKGKQRKTSEKCIVLKCIFKSMSIPRPLATT